MLNELKAIADDEICAQEKSRYLRAPATNYSRSLIENYYWTSGVLVSASQQRNYNKFSTSEGDGV